MHSKIVIFLVLLGIGLNVSAYPNFQANEDGTISGFLEAEDYDNLEDSLGQYQKRFWSPHPSDYNPLRRPVPAPRGSKRDDGVVYHPIPRIVTIKQQRSNGHVDEYPENVEIFEGGRQKKQTRPTTLIFRLGSWGLRGGRKPDKNTVGGTQSPST
ncbi:uncharacterized protein LOC110846357 [Folsomia candida]|uniref:Uncharacterized protein n=1 Tax=Folsomia candida TaxID=158441 RepID=A0A226EYY4_FOLCA|nr:uncharacterized protein LOC110846357 [Folsomia candida]OXA61856.1 hypothetical protein Fcan01_02389 [Folsomia candida]